MVSCQADLLIFLHRKFILLVLITIRIHLPLVMLVKLLELLASSMSSMAMVNSSGFDLKEKARKNGDGEEVWQEREERQQERA